MGKILTTGAVVLSLALVAYGVCTCAPPFDYYVDSVNGLDSNLGTSAGAAFQTLAAAKTALTANPTKLRLGLARGSVFREILSLGNGYVVASYGTGRLPLIDGSDVVTAGLWSKTGGRTNVYQFTWVPPEAGLNAFYGVTEDGVCLLQVYALADCDSTAGSFYAPTLTITGDAIYVHATGDGNPASNGKLYECTKRDRPLLMGDDATVRQVKVRMGFDSDGALSTGLNSLWDGVVVCDGSRHIAYINSGTVVSSYFYGGFGEGAYTNGSGQMGSNFLVAFTSAAAGHPLVFENDFFVNDTPGLYASAIFAHSGDAGYPLGYYKNVYSYKCGAGTFGAGAGAMSINHCVADQAGSVGGYATVTSVKDSLFIGTSAVGQGWVFGGDSVVTISNSRFANMLDLNRIANAGAGSVSITNCEFYDATTDTQGGAFSDTYNVLPVTFSNNVSQDKYWFIAVPTGYTADQNVYWHKTGTAHVGWITNGTAYYTFADYTTANPTQDTHSQYADPLYLGDPAQDNWTKNAASPAVTLGAGANANCATRPNWTAIIAYMRAL